MNNTIDKTVSMWTFKACLLRYEFVVKVLYSNDWIFNCFFFKINFEIRKKKS